MLFYLGVDNGESFRGKKLEAVPLHTGRVHAVEPKSTENVDADLGCLVILSELKLAIFVAYGMDVSARN